MEQTDEEDDGEEFVTALPDKYAQRKGKRKQRGPDAKRAKRVSGDTGRKYRAQRESTAFGSEDPAEGEQHRSRRYEFEAQGSNIRRDSGGERNSRTRQSRWGNEPSLPQRPNNNFDCGDGMSTTVGRDEVVEDEVQF